ncbi:MAG: hypothetical protein E6L00_04025 [Thaumarchaeota archaeon]|nr:MAG: hypothetical protein E6L00_04025 [Nitrososphaerota archaeon]
MAKTSNVADNFLDKICVTKKILIIKIRKALDENSPRADVIKKNHNENPSDTTIALNRGLDISISNRINQSY